MRDAIKDTTPSVNILNLTFIKNLKIEFRYSREPSGIMVAVAPHTTFNDVYMPDR